MISSDSYIDLDSLFSRFVQRASLALAISSPGAWMKNESTVWSPLPLQGLCQCVSLCRKCAERRMISRKGCQCRRVDWLCYVASAQVGDKYLNTKETLVWTSMDTLGVRRRCSGPLHMSVQFLSATVGGAHLKTAACCSSKHNNGSSKKKNTSIKRAYHFTKRFF